jgi:DNA-binding LacI/PurR family transcriptional regulator
MESYHGRCLNRPEFIRNPEPESRTQRKIVALRPLASVGHSNNDFASYLVLTTVDQNPLEMERVALRRLLQRIETPNLDPDVIETPVKLIVRTSCGTSSSPNHRPS